MTKLNELKREKEDLVTRYKKLMFKKPRPIASLASYGRLIEVKITHIAVERERLGKRKKRKRRKYVPKYIPKKQEKRGKKYF